MSKSAMLVLGAMFLAGCSSSTTDPGATSGDAGGGGVDAQVHDSATGTYAADTSTPIADSGGDVTAADAGLIGSTDNPASDCSEIHAQRPTAPSGTYSLLVGGGSVASDVYCDMTTSGGGWTKVTSAFTEGTVTLFLGSTGSTGHMMLKCSDSGTDAIVSPIDGAAWMWTGSAFIPLSGDWTVNGATVTCGANSEYASTSCTTWWGVGCDSGPGSDKLVPGVKGAAASATCATTTAAHTEGKFSICGSDDYAAYSVFVRSI